MNSNSNNKYKDTIKVEFRSLIENIVRSTRSSFHLYTIHRILSLGLLVDFTFEYIPLKDKPTYMGISLDLKEYGKVLFIVNLESNYVRLSSEQDVQILEDFLLVFDTHIEDTSKRSWVFSNT